MRIFLPLLLIVTVLVFSAPAIKAQNIKIDKKLQAALHDLTKDFDGVAGVYVYNLKTNKQAGINADTIFPTASIVKVPILIGLFDRIEKDSLDYHLPLTYLKEMEYGGSGLMQFFKDSTQTDLSVAAALMITHSDNVAAIWCQKLAGGGESINRVMSHYGMKDTRVNSKTTGREEDWERYGWGQTTPREMATLLIKIRNGALVNKAASEQMYRIMTNVYYHDYALSQIPPHVQTASKQGMVNESRSELVMVNAPHGDYVFYIATKNNTDTSWEYNNEAWELARTISAYLWNYFEPKSEWKPAKGWKQYAAGLEYE